MYTFGTTVIGDRTYTTKDCKQFLAIEKCDIEDGFYGGRVKYIGITDTNILLLMTDANNVIDVGTNELDELSIDLIRELCKKRKLKFAQNTSKDKLIEILN